jgi:pimeloyl-ACP methyl ester carboxylesterase
MSSAARSLFVALGALVAAGGVALLTHPISGPGLIIALAIASAVLWLGLTVAWVGVRGTFDENEPFEPGSLRRITVASASAMALVLAYLLGGVSYWIKHDHTSSDGLTIPSSVPKQPGKLISFEEFTRGVPAGAQAWRILYTTTRSDGVPALSSGLVVVKRDGPAGPRPVIAWAHGTTGIAQSCAPSGNDDPITFTSIPALSGALDKGWAIVATDYIGLGTPGPHPYLIGQGEGRSVLDAVRAARQLNTVKLQTNTVIWGHSQGGGAALWAGILAPTYAPSLKVEGVVGIAPASDLVGLVGRVSQYPSGALFASYVIAAYSANYPDVHFDAYVRPAAREPVRRAAALCISDSQALAAIAKAFDFSKPFFTIDPVTGALGSRLRQNIPTEPIAAPVLIAQGTSDVVIPESLQTAYVAERCRADKGVLDYRTYPGRDHITIVASDSPLVADLLAWTEARFEGKPATSTC